ncbi:hypothetical protein K502DRAFT_361036 [Neoconidiobolus thromboides FSU 785]|nr:hypothetical protein K502DRAFT_361036 [Neoconidiobolus thromboides FSU 785]
MNNFLLNTILLAFTATIASLPPSDDVHLSRRGFGSYPGYGLNGGYSGLNAGSSNFYPGYGLGGFGGGYGGYGGFNNFGSFGFPTVITNDAFNANANNFNLNEFDSNKQAAVFTDNVHSNNVNSNNANVSKQNSAAII